MKTRAILFMIAGAAVLSALFLLFRPSPQAAAPSPAAADPAAPLTFELVVREGRRVSGPAVMRVKQGDGVTIRVLSDRADELHVHGYDRHVELRAGEPALLHFTADRSGRFECELHESRLDLGALEVEPR